MQLPLQRACEIDDQNNRCDVFPSIPTLIVSHDMNSYQNVLVAVDLKSSYQKVLDKALAIAGNTNNISLVYVSLAPVYFEPYGVALGNEFYGEIKRNAEIQLLEIAHQYGISENKAYTLVGSPADEIHFLAEQQNVDLIVIGTHGTSGIKLLLGSTANAVLHGVKCDVLAVKI
jgi:universal stress protein A